LEYLIDTHVFLWAASDPGRLSPAARDLFAGKARLWLSHVSAWEMVLKAGKLSLPAGVRSFVGEQAPRLRLRALPISLAHIFGLAELPWHHRDPFDRMLVAQAQAEGLTLLSADRQLARYRVPVIW
jgi:PIN domain nuclease of toxin-antitoxin system